MAKPPASPPHSDLNGVDEDEVRNVDAAVEADQDSGDLARASRESAGRPDYSDERKKKGQSDGRGNRDDRSR